MNRKLLLCGNKKLLPYSLFNLICLDFFGGFLFPAAAVSLDIKKCNKEMQMCLQLSPSRCAFLLQ